LTTPGDDRLTVAKFSKVRTLRQSPRGKYPYSQREVPLFFWSYSNFLITQCRIGSLHAKNQLNQSRRFSRTPTCDRRTDERTQDDSIRVYRTCIASRGKKLKISPRLREYILLTFDFAGCHVAQAVLVNQNQTQNFGTVEKQLKERKDAEKSRKIKVRKIYNLFLSVFLPR